VPFSDHHDLIRVDLFLEVRMSNHASQPEPVPCVILVSDLDKCHKRDKPAPRKTSAASELPWLWIGVGVGGGWLALVLVIAWVTYMQNAVQPPAPRNLPAIVDAIPAPPVAPVAKKPVLPVAEPEGFPDLEVKPDKKPVDLNVYADCQQIGTDVLFMKNPPDAFKQARADKKMVFIVHLSGNLEDKDFT
jgi:hypothetical protein